MKMSDFEDDYMSDKLLQGCEKSDIRPGLMFNKTEKRKHDLHKKKVELQTVKKPKSYHEREKETRESGLNTAISTENKGFKLLEKMGYKAGTSLGKSMTGIVEPININLKETSSGLGRESHIKEVIETKRKNKVDKLKHVEHHFRTAYAEKNASRTLAKDICKAQRICEELDARKGIEEPLEEFYWTKETMKKLRKGNRKEGSDEEESEEEEEEQYEFTEELLGVLLNYLRETYFYCVYCAITGEDKADLEANCPGISREDHDE